MEDLHKILLIKERNQWQSITNYTLFFLHILRKEFISFIYSKINMYEYYEYII